MPPAQAPFTGAAPASAPLPIPKAPAPGSAARRPIDDLLPPTVPTKPSAGPDADLLPPATGAGDMAPQPLPTMREVPLPTMSAPASEANPEFKVREKHRKVIRVGDEEIELRQLSPEEKAKRRLIKNIIMIVIAMTVILAVVWFFLK